MDVKTSDLICNFCGRPLYKGRFNNGDDYGLHPETRSNEYITCSRCDFITRTNRLFKHWIDRNDIKELYFAVEEIKDQIDRLDNGYFDKYEELLSKR